MSGALHVESDGHGETLVMLHGWGANLRVFEKLSHALRDHYRIVRVDLPGHGQSARYDAGQGPSLDQLSERLQALIPTPALWLGWSLGGQIALRIATRFAASVTGLVIVCSSPRFVATTDWPHAMPPAVLTQFAASLRRAPRQTVSDFLELVVRGSQAADASLQELQRALLEHGEACPIALADGLRLLQSSDLRADLATLQCPTLVLSGEYDRIASPAASRALAAALPRAQHHEFRRAAHAPFLSHQREFVAQLQSWREQVAA